MNLKRVTIVNTDIISVSIALGLKRTQAIQAESGPPEIVGYDDNVVAARLARSRGAFDRVERKLERACRQSDLVIIASPLSAMRETFATIAPHLEAGCLVTDTAPLKAPVMRWAEELLPPSVSFVGGHPIPNPTIVGPDPLEELDDADVGLLKRALYCLTTPPETSSAVISASASLAKALEAYPLFIDATEHDGLQAGVEGMPDLLAVALLRATVDTPGWQEMRKLAGYRFATATKPVSDIHERYAALFLNRENVLRRLNVLLGELTYLHDMLSHEDTESLEEAFTAATEGRTRWVEERAQGMWTQEGHVNLGQIPTTQERITQLFFGDRISRLRDRGKNHPGIERSSED